MRQILVLLCLLASSAFLRAEDFNLISGYDDGVGTKTYNSGAGTVELRGADSRWLWYLQVNQPGMYEVSVRAAVSAANAGATVEVGDFVPQRNMPGSKATAVLTSTHATTNSNPQWQTVGSVWVPAAGLRFFQVRIPQYPGASPGLIHGLRLTGPGTVTASPTWGIRTSACDIYFSPLGSARRVFYGEMVPRPEPTPALDGTHTVVNTPTGYMGNNDNAFQSLWVSGGLLPEVLVAAGSSRVYTHEGTGSTTVLDDFFHDPARRRKVINISVTDGGTSTLTTFLVGEVGQRWHFGGRMKQPTISQAGNSGFLENHTITNSQVTWRSCAWGNVWFFGVPGSGQPQAWWPANVVRGHLRGPSPAAYPGTSGTFPYGKVRRRQDMMEMIIGGLINIGTNDTTYDALGNTAPDLPTLNLAYQLQSREKVNQASHATAGTAYSDTASVKAQIRDPFSSVAFSFQKVSGPAWVSVSAAGNLTGTPAVADEGQNTLIVRATDSASGISGEFTVGVYVRKAGGAANAPAFQDVLATTMTTATVDDPKLIQFPVVDPDGGTPTFTITAGNAGGQFGFSGAWLIKTAPLTAGQSYPLTIQVADSTALTASINVTVTAVAATNGVTEDVWYNIPGTTLADLTTNSRYPDSPSQMRMLSDFNETYTTLSTGYRQRAWITPPTTGSYTFSLSASYTTSELRVSTDASPANLALVANSSGMTGSVTLTAGQRYYIEALGMNGDDYNEGKLAARWSGPGITTQTIAASYLTPIECATPKLWDGTAIFRDLRTGEPCRDFIRPKIETLHLHSATTYQKISGPAWISISANGTITGTPAAGDAGSVPCIVRATVPGGHWDEAEFIIPVITNSAPVIANSNITLTGINEGQEITGSLADQAADADLSTRLGFGDMLSWKIIAGPPWLGVEATGELFGKPGAAHIGLNTFTAQVTDRSGVSATTQVQITVADIANTPFFSPSPVSIKAVSNRGITATLATYVVDPDIGETFTFEKLSGPAWLSVAANGTLSGTPLSNHLGVNTFSVRVTDSTARSATATLKIEVLDGQIFVHEPFTGDITEDPDYVGASEGGIGWSSYWSFLNNLDWHHISPGTTFGGLPSSGRKSNMGGQGTTILRTFAKSVTIGTGDGELDEVWLSARLDLNGVAGAGHSIRVVLYQSGNSVGFIGKNTNGGLGFDIGGSGFQTVNSLFGATSPGIGSGTEGNWLFVVRLTSVNGGTGTQIRLYAAKDTQIAGNLAKLRDPANNFPHQASFTVSTKVSFNQLGMYRWNNTASFIDELRVANTLAQAVPVDMTTAPVFSATPIQRTFTVAQPFVDAITADVTDADSGDAKIFTKLSGPDWLTLNSIGVISGTPPAGSVGTHDFSIRVADSAYNLTTGTLRLTIANPTHQLTYTAGPNGSLTGTTTQTITEGSNGTPVTAVPHFGHAFVNWSDNNNVNPRTDLNITAPLSLTANFTPLADITEVVTATNTNGTFTAKFRTNAGNPCRIERSTDLINWTTLHPNLTAPANGEINLTDNTTGMTRVFYRLVLE